MPPLYEMSRSLHEKTIYSSCYYAILLEMFACGPLQVWGFYSEHI